MARKTATPTIGQNVPKTSTKSGKGGTGAIIRQK